MFKLGQKDFTLKRVLTSHKHIKQTDKRTGNFQFLNCKKISRSNFSSTLPLQAVKTHCRHYIRCETGPCVFTSPRALLYLLLPGNLGYYEVEIFLGGNPHPKLPTVQSNIEPNWYQSNIENAGVRE